MTHPSLMPSFFAPPMPFHPEELHKHVKELERIYLTLPETDGNGRIALAKSVISATASFVEGCLDALCEQVLGELGMPSDLSNPLLNRLWGLNVKIDYVKHSLAPKRNGWLVINNNIAMFVENRLPNKQQGLLTLRNLIDHGDVVNIPALRMDNITFFRITACKYLERVYQSLGVGRPGWLNP